MACISKPQSSLPSTSKVRCRSCFAARLTEFLTRRRSRYLSSLKELAQDGYIFVFQNLRGRFKSEGVFNLSSLVDLTDPKATNETTDAYDSIEWLVKNVPNNNGKVGMYGVSYDGLTTALTLLHPHPALKAISEQASPVDQWMNDDDHRYGALRESYDFEYAVMEQADKNKNTHFDFETYDTYEWYLDLGPALQYQCEISSRLYSLLEFDRRPSRLRRILEEGSVGQPTSCLDRAEPECCGILGSGRSLGSVADFSPRGRKRSAAHQLHRRRSVVSRRMAASKGDTIGLIPFGGHETAREFRENIEAPFFRYYLHGEGEKPAWQASTFQSGSNTWRTYPVWPPKEAEADEPISARGRNALVYRALKPDAGTSYREYVSDPANPVPYRERPISPTYPGRRLAHLGGCRPALRRSSPRRAFIRERIRSITT